MGKTTVRKAATPGRLKKTEKAHEKEDRKPASGKKTQSGIYEIEVIKSARLTKDGKWEYHVKWSGYPDSQNTWEPESGVKPTCLRMLESFWKDAAKQGLQIKASSDWMNREKRYFQETYGPKTAATKKPSHDKKITAAKTAAKKKSLTTARKAGKK